MSYRLVQLQRQVANLQAAKAARGRIITEDTLRAVHNAQFDPWQEEVIASTERQILLNCSRQSGKSRTSAWLGYKQAMTVPGSTVLVVSRALRQAQLLFDTIMEFYGPTRFLMPSIIENRRSMKLANGSKIYALPGSEATIRGFSNVSLLIVDEASKVPDALMAAVRPMLAVSQGRLIALSTPWGKRGWFFESWESGGDDWRRWEVPATECPRLSPEFLALERRTLPSLWFESEYLCSFVETDDQLFLYEDIEAAMASLPPFFEQGAA